MYWWYITQKAMAKTMNERALWRGKNKNTGEWFIGRYYDKWFPSVNRIAHYIREESSYEDMIEEVDPDTRFGL